MFDTDRSGTITIQEVKEVFGGMNCNLSHEELIAMFSEVDTDLNGEIS